MANGNIINAAAAAYSVPKVDISGFVQGFASIAGALIKNKQKINKGKEYLTKKSGQIKSSFKDYKNYANLVRNKYIADDNYTLDDATQSINNLIDGARSLEELRKVADELYGDNGYSADISAVDQNYLNQIRSGNLVEDFEVNGKKYPGIMAFDQDMVSFTMGPDANFENTEQLINHFKNYATPTEAKTFVKNTNSFTNRVYKDKDTWEAAAGELKTNLYGMSEKQRNAYLLDNKQYVGVDKSFSFVDYYTDEGLFEKNSDEAKQLKKALNSTDMSKEQKDLTKRLIVAEMMKEDKNIDADIDKFYNAIINSKKPIIKVDGKTMLFDPKTTSGAKMQEIDNLFSSIPSGGKYAMKFGKSKVFFTPAKTSGVDNFTGEYTILDQAGAAVKDSSTDKPITFNAYDPDDIKYALGRVADRYLGFDDLPEYNHYIANVDLTRFVIKGNPVVGADTPVGANTKYNSNSKK